LDPQRQALPARHLPHLERSPDANEQPSTPAQNAAPIGIEPMIHIYDGINVVRRGLHTDPTGRYVRKAVTDMYAVPGPHVWVWDGSGGNDRRRQVYPEYK